MKFIDSARFMATSLSNLVDNLTEGIHKIKCKDPNWFLEYESVKDRRDLRTHLNFLIIPINLFCC